jgi:ribosomal-protein-alanine N-acetyltransferase
MSTVTQTQAYIRHHRNSQDNPRLLEIDKNTQKYPWGMDTFTEWLNRNDVTCLVAEVQHQDKIILGGFIIYQITKDGKIYIINISVDPIFQRCSVGSQLMGRVISKLDGERRKEIILEVREHNDAAISFYRSLGFKGVRVSRNFYQNTDYQGRVIKEDAYIMRYTLESPPP